MYFAIHTVDCIEDDIVWLLKMMTTSGCVHFERTLLSVCLTFESLVENSHNHSNLAKES